MDRYCATFVPVVSTSTSNHEQRKGERGTDFLLVFVRDGLLKRSWQNSNQVYGKPYREFKSLPLRQPFTPSEL